MDPWSFRQVVVDHMDPAMEYTGQWSIMPVTDGMNFNWNGPTYNNSLHSTPGNSSLSFTFSGSTVALIGRTNFSNNSGVLSPTFSCSVDGITIPSAGFTPVETNNYVFCQRNPGELQNDGQHQIVLNILPSSSKQSFYFERIEYTPSSNVSLSQATVRVNYTDPAIRYGAGWNNLPSGDDRQDFVEITQFTGAEMVFPFVGKSVKWNGYFPDSFSQNATSGIYTIDDGSPTSFPIFSGNQNLQTSIFNQLIFQTHTVDPGPHTLKVTYQGGDGFMALTLYTLYIVDSAVSSSSSSISTSAGFVSVTTTESRPSTRTGSSPPVSKAAPRGAIVGGVVGGIGVLALCLGLWLWYKRRQRISRLPNSLESNPLAIVPEPRLLPNTKSLGGTSGFIGRPGGATSGVRGLNSQSNGSAPTSSSQLEVLTASRTRGEAVTNLNSVPSNTSAGPTPESSGTGNQRGQTIQHTDSGLRLPNNSPLAEEELIELPPYYSEV